MDRIADFRRVFAHVVAARADRRDPAIREAFARVPRHELVGPGPWYFTERGGPAESDDPAILYPDVAMGLARDRGIPTGLPSLHARRIAACAVSAGERVSHIGSGSGYCTAVLAELVGEAGQVVACVISPHRPSFRLNSSVRRGSFAAPVPRMSKHATGRRPDDCRSVLSALQEPLSATPRRAGAPAPRSARRAHPAAPTPGPWDPPRARPPASPRPAPAAAPCTSDRAGAPQPPTPPW